MTWHGRGWLGTFSMAALAASACQKEREQSERQQLAPPVATDAAAQPKQEQLAGEESPAHDDSRGREPTAGAELRAAHQAADRASSPEQIDQATTRLQLSFDRLSQPDQAAGALLPQQDAAYRIARLHLKRQRPAQAKRWAERGLDLSEEPSVLRANLLMALADAEKQLGNDDAERSALLEALRLNQELLDEELDTP